MSETEFEEYVIDREIIAFVRSNPLLWEKRIKIDKKNKDTISKAFSQIGSLLSKPLTGHNRMSAVKNLSHVKTHKSMIVLLAALLFYLSYLFRPLIKKMKFGRLKKSKILICGIQEQDENKENINTVIELPKQDAASTCWSSMSSSVSHSSTIPPPDHFYNKKKAAVDKVQSAIQDTATKLSFTCDTICATLTQPQSMPTASVEEDPALVLIKNGLKNVASNVQFKCLSEIMIVLDKYSSPIS